MVRGYPTTECGVPNRFVLMKRRMFFKIGVTLIIFVGIVLFFIVDVENEDRAFYPRIPVERGSVYFMEMAMVEQDEPPLETIIGIANDNGWESRESINAQIDKEQNDLLARNHKRNGDNAASQETSDSVKQDFYYDNSIPDSDRQTKKDKIDTFDPKDQMPVLSRDFSSPGTHKTLVHLCVVVCENRAAEALTMLKSSAIVTIDVALVFHIVADKERQPIIQAELDSWPSHLRHHIAYHIYDTAFPHGPVTLTAWNKLYKPCASQRLFLPDRFPSIDSLIYVDTDTIFLQSVGDLWSFFKDFNSSQLVGLVRESEDGTAGWYNRFASHPYYGPYGVNSGVMLMNLTRIRVGTDWLSVLQEDYEKYRLAMTWGDQDLINIYLSKRPDQVFVLPCDWNYRTDHCMYTSNCRAAEQKGVSLIHASRGAFYSSTEPIFGAVYLAFKHVVLGPGQMSSLVSELEHQFKHASSETSSCNFVSSLFLTQLVRLAVLQEAALPKNSHLGDSKEDEILDPSIVNRRLKSQQNKKLNLELYNQKSRQKRATLQKKDIGVGRRADRKTENSKSVLRNDKVEIMGEMNSLNYVKRGVKQLNSIETYDLRQNDVYINNKLKAGKLKNVMTREKDVLKSVEKKVMYHGTGPRLTLENKMEIGGRDHRHKVGRRVVGNNDRSRRLERKQEKNGLKGDMNSPDYNSDEDSLQQSVRSDKDNNIT